nr:hypothetical protein [Hugenholtzia roseola]
MPLTDFDPTQELDIETRWFQLTQRLKGLFQKTPDLEAVLFLVGVQELGRGKRIFSKEEKQDLMHMATCKLLSLLGYYQLEGIDKEGWAHWKNIRPLPFLAPKEQEKLLKMCAVEYFEKEIF